MMAGLGRRPLQVFLESPESIPSSGNRPVWLWKHDGTKSKGLPLRSVLYVVPSVEMVEVNMKETDLADLAILHACVRLSVTVFPSLCLRRL